MGYTLKETVGTTTVFSKYLAAIIAIASFALNAILAALKQGPITAVESDQIIILIIGAIVVYFVPLLNTNWAGLLKVIAAALTALGTAVDPFLRTAAWPTPAEWITIAFAVASALGVGIGASARVSAIRAAVARQATARHAHPAGTGGTIVNVHNV
jgi:hypothetical protein